MTLLGHATYAAGKPVALDLDRIEFGRTRATGRVVFATASDPALHVTVDASLVDLRAGVKGGAASGPVPPTPSQAEARAAARARAAAAASRKRGQAWTVALTMARVELGTGHDPTGVRVTAADDGLVVNRAQVDGQLGGGAFRLSLKPAPQGRRLEAHAADAGTLLQALDVTGSVQGGMLDLNGQFDDGAADHPLSGTLSIGRFEVAGAPAVARLLQAATLYGVVEALHGPGLAISRLVAPFRYADQVLSLRSGRAFSASLGVTAKGEIDLVARRADLSGTIVPAYFFNTLLGRLPLVGKLFSPEAGGGLFAATYTLAGPLAEPKVSVNPLAALTPGILRGLFGLTEPAPDGPRAAIN